MREYCKCATEDEISFLRVRGQSVWELTVSLALGCSSPLPVSVRLAICCMTSYALAHFLEETEIYSREALLMRALGAILYTPAPSSRSHLSCVHDHRRSFSQSLQSLSESMSSNVQFASSVISLCEVTIPLSPSAFRASQMRLETSSKWH